MIDAYKDLIIVQRDMCYFAFKGEVMQTQVFNERDVPLQYRDLLSASPLLYMQLSRTADIMYQLNSMIMPVAKESSGHMKELLDNIMEVTRLLKADALRCMSIAEVGPKRAMLHERDDKEK